MAKKHFMCTHTWVGDEAKQMGLEATSQMTDREFFASIKTPRAETLQHWMGQEDFFYCHWYAEDEDAIFDSLEAAGFNSLMVSLPHEMQRYVKSDDIKDETLVNPDKAQLDNPQKMNPNFSRLFNRHAWSDDLAFDDLATAVFVSLSSDSAMVRGSLTP